MKKITIVTFSGVSKNKGSGPSFMAWQIAYNFFSQGKLKNIVCLNYDSDEIPEKYYVTPFNKWINQLIFKTMNKINNIADFRIRRIKEEYFDIAVSNNQVLKQSDIILFLKPSFPKTVKKAKKLGIKTAGLATVLHPKYNYRIIKDEYAKYGLTDQLFNYTDKKRVKNLSVFFDELDYIFLPSPNVTKYFVGEGINESKLLYTPTINGGVPGNNFCPKQIYNSNGIFRLIHVSHMNLIKGIGRLLEAWKNLDLKSAELILVGSMDDNIKEIVKKIGAQNVVLAGATNCPEKFYLEADVMVQPSLSDAGPFTILEAMACGLPVIASDACGNSDLIENYNNGIVFDSHNDKELEQAIIWFYNNQKRIESMGKASRNAVEQCTMAKFINALIDGLNRE